MTMTAPFARERHIAELAVLRASILTKKVLSSVGAITKADASPVTVADFAAQALLISALHTVFPGDAFLGEEASEALRSDESLRDRVWELVSSTSPTDPESGEVLAVPATVEEMLELIDLGGNGHGGSTGRFWVMDPIDGTATFLRGEQYAVSLALIEDGREVLGVLGCPNLRLQGGRVKETSVDTEGLGIMLSAVKGQGSMIRFMTASGLEAACSIEPLKGSSNPQDLHIIDCLQSKSSRHDLIRQLADKLGAPFPSTDVWSSHIRYAALIVGGGDLHVRIPAKLDTKTYVWDHAGAQLIFTEAGGQVTDLDGRQIDFGAGRDLSRNRGLVAAREGVHEVVIEELAGILQDAFY
ncbi:hypothetical protein EDB81DRAFT_175786 [Dactylonectria macrodidyma]|uniref:3'(2'),5'-bisphosphate nucleotidase n=1 Tax=Dactylonectria macrodidyma TaxID=307937 RepID=A0A9P9FRY8_9HYPO|nr:hypothetical protein EDB81DRAFT_175786 [Dactylonectria macrodidyma]